MPFGTEMPDHLAEAWFTGMVLRRWSPDFALLPGRVVEETETDGKYGKTQTMTFRPRGHDLTGTLLFRRGRCICGWWNGDVDDHPEPEDMYPELTRRPAPILEMMAA